MALEIVEALERGGPPQRVVTAEPASKGRPPKGVATKWAESAPERKSVQTEPPTVVVDALHRGKYTSIAEAIQKEKAGTRILVRPGHYREGLVIEKPLEIVGEGNRDDVVVEATEKMLCGLRRQWDGWRT
jgi:F-box protein 11